MSTSEIYLNRVTVQTNWKARVNKVFSHNRTLNIMRIICFEGHENEPSIFETTAS